MKSFITAVLTVLLFFVGNVKAQPHYALTATPNTLTFNATASPSQPQSYTVRNTGNSYMPVGIYPSAHTELSFDGGNTWTTSHDPFLLNPNAAVQVWVRFVTSVPITSINEQAISARWPEGDATASVQISGTAPLPIQLASFRAAILTGSGVSLKWATFSETNNYGFEVQRNGAKVAFVAGNGTTIQRHEYSYVDNPSPGQYHYCLKQVDLDGTATYSESILVDVSAPEKFALNQNYPNPFNPATQIAFSIAKEGPVSLRVYDILGRGVATLVNENRKAGQYAERFDGGKVSSGLYIYVLRSAEGQLIGRMILSK